MTTRCRLIRPLAAVVTILALAPSLLAQAPPVENRLAVEMERAAMIFLGGGTLSVGSIDAASRLLEQALALDPGNAELWRTMLSLAALAERDDLEAIALRRILELDPADEGSRLRRIAAYLDQAQTAESRLESYRRLLAPDVRDQLGPAVASRLALDLAHLERRVGNTDAFGLWLAEAVALDPSNRAAAALAAGYFRLYVDDPFGEAELLTSLMLADPTDPDGLAALGQLLLAHGAYTGAARLYRLAAMCQRIRQGGSSADLLADYAIALWATGDADGALAVIRAHQQRVNLTWQLEQRRARPEMSLPDINRLEHPIGPTVAAVRALIHVERDSAEADRMIARLIESFERVIGTAADADPPDPRRVAELRLQLALVLVWSGREGERLDSLLEEVEAWQPLSETATRRFAGWRALRDGDAAEAEALFATHADSDPPSAMGRGLALIELGRAAEGARELLGVARGQPGTLLGAWAVNRLADVLGRRAPLSPLAARLEALIATIPRPVDRYPSSPTTALSLRVRPIQATFDAYEPIVVNIEVTNNSPYPMAIDRDGPIRPQVIVRPTAQVLTGKPAEEFPPVVVDIDRRLRLNPGQSITVPYDLRRSWVGRVMNEYAASGGLLQVDGLVNFTTNLRGHFEPGMLGSRAEAPLIRIEGAKVDEAWMRQATEQIADPATPDRLRTIALLANIVCTGGKRAALPVEADRETFDAALNAVLEVFPTLEPAAQAWLLAVTPMTDAAVAASMLEVARKSEERLVRLTYLLFHLSGPDDPMFDAARRTEDPLLIAVADALQPLLRKAVEGGDDVPGASGRPGS